MILMPYVSYVYIMNVLLVRSYISDVETLALAYIFNALRFDDYIIFCLSLLMAYLIGMP